MKSGRLILTRKSGQAIKVGKDILITIASSRNGQVKVAIEAPTHIRVLRAELEDSSPPQGECAAFSAQTSGNAASNR